jgi:four helix bundle protein
MEQGYKRLEIYQLAHSLAIRVHEMTLTLPSLEKFEEGSQVRRSSKSVSSQIVEGYSLRKYKNEFLHYLYRAYGSSQETKEHLEYLFETKSLTEEKLYNQLVQDYDNLCGKIMRYIQYVEREYETPYFVKESSSEYFNAEDNDVKNFIEPPQTRNLKPPTSL